MFKTPFTTEQFVKMYFSLLLCGGFVFVFMVWVINGSINNSDRIPVLISRLIQTTARFPSDILKLGKFISSKNNGLGSFDKYKNVGAPDIGIEKIEGVVTIPFIREDGRNCWFVFDLGSGRSITEEILAPVSSTARYSDRIGNCENWRQSTIFTHNRIWNPHVSKNRKIYYILPWNDIVALDFDTRQELWRVYGAFHHSMDIDSDGNIWVCGSVDSMSPYPGPHGSHDSISTVVSHDGKSLGKSNYEDQVIVKISSEGKVLKIISVTDLIIKSGRDYLLFGITKNNIDPLHLNQVRIVRGKHKGLQDGSLVISMRNISTIMIIDPNNSQVLYSVNGPFSNQHSPVIVDASHVLLLDNHSPPWIYSNNKWVTQVLTLDLLTRSIKTNILPISIAERLMILGEGRVLAIRGTETVLLEDSMGGFVSISRNENLLFKWQNKFETGQIGIVSWSEYYPVESDAYDVLVKIF